MTVAAFITDAREPDPTGTAGIRISFRAAAKLRLNQLRSQLRIAVMENDLLGLGGVASSAASFQPAEARLRALNGWLEAVAPAMLGGAWLSHWIAKAWHSGERIAAHQVASSPLGDGSGALLVLAEAELDGIIAVTVQQITREAARALANSKLKRPRVWLRLARVLDQVTKPRLCALANTITVMAHNHGRGAVYRAAGYSKVGITPEHELLRIDAMFAQDRRTGPSRARVQEEYGEHYVGVATAGDAKVCQECEDYASSSPHDIDDALDTLPMHIGCRCSIYPWRESDIEEDSLTHDYNKEHEPAGSSIGGQFASSGVEGSESEFERWGGAAHGETVSPAQAAKVKELAAKTPGLKNLLPYLAPDEVNRLKKATVGKMVEVFTKYPVEAEEMAAVAYSGRAKQGWYRKSAKALVDVFGATDAPRFAALMAALSPQTGVEDNAINALNTWTNWLKAGRPIDRDAIVTVLGRSVQGEKGAESILPAWINNSVVALSTPADQEIVLSGPKVDSFAENLRGHVNAVTNDSWMANYLGIKQAMFARRTPVPGKYSGKGPMYIATAAVTRKAAEILTEKTGSKWTPAEIQETIWSWAKTLYEHASADKTTIEQLLKAGSVTHEDIADTPDFAILFTQNVYRKILEGGGYAEQAAALGAGTGESGGATARGSLLESEGSGIAPDAFTGFLFRAAGRLDKVRIERAQRKAERGEDGLDDAQESGEPSATYVGHPGEGYTAAACIDTDGVIKTTEASDVATAIYEKRAVKYYARQISDVADFSWEPDKHPRGQPENKGQFGPGGGGAEPIPEHVKPTSENIEATKSGIEERFKELTTKGPDKPAPTGGGRAVTPEERDYVITAVKLDLSLTRKEAQTQPVKDLDELYEKAFADEAGFKDEMTALAADFGAEVKFAKGENGTTLKKRATSERKVNTEYNGDASQLRDVLRSTIVSADVVGTREAAYEYIKQKGDDIVRVKDRIIKSVEGGYRDILVNVRTASGLIAEVQFNSKNMLNAKLGRGHEIYDLIRTNRGAMSKEQLLAFEKESSDLYTKAYENDGNGKGWQLQTVKR